jgi:tetratricopeptide (TPR) repeat protein
VLLRSVAALLAIACCFFAILAAARFGYARLLGKYAVASSSIAAADQAVALAPADAEGHRARARVLNRLQEPAEARRSLEIATSLRYRDDYLWLELGGIREELGDTSAALVAFDQAVRYAPYYAHTYWQRGNLKLRAGQYNEALEDLRAAAASRKSYVPNLIDLAWGLSRGDVKTTEQLLQVGTDYERLAFARFLAKKGKGKECVEQFRLLVTGRSDENRRELVRELIATKAFRDAFELWRTDASLKPPIMLNGGFEDPIDLPGVDNAFGWYVLGKTEPKIVRDAAEKLSGRTSLLLRFNGDWKAPGETIMQRIVVEPEKRYRISFGVRTKEIVTGAPPAIAVKEATNDQVLGQSEAFPTPSSGWQTMSFEFSTTASTQAIVLEFMRAEGTCSPCPIFGELWVDDFVIEYVSAVNSQR